MKKFIILLSLALIPLSVHGQGISFATLTAPSSVASGATTNLTPTVANAVDVSQFITYAKPLGRLQISGTTSGTGSIKVTLVTSADGTNWDATTNSLIYLTGIVSGGKLNISDTFNLAGIKYLAVGQIVNTPSATLSSLVIKVAGNP